MDKIKQLDVTSDYQSIFELSEFAFQYKLNPDDLENKKEEAMRHIIWGHMDDKQIAAKLHLIPLSVYINGKEMKMGGVSSVATWPEYRRQGLVKELLHHSLTYMKRQGHTVSYLYPFSFGYYRKYGWELAFGKKEYSIPIERFSNTKSSPSQGYVRRENADVSLLNTLYATYAKKFNGMLARDEKWWHDRILNNKDMHVAIAYNENDEASGYILFNVKKDVFHVMDHAYTSQVGRELLLQFISNHDSMVEKVKMTVPENDHLPLLLNEPRFEQQTEPYFMARIVDVQAFLKQFPFQEGNEKITLHVTDDFLPENTGVYQLNTYGKHTDVTYLNGTDASRKGLHCSIQKLTAMCLGYIQPTELFEMGIVEGDKQDAVSLEKIIPEQQPYFADFF